VSDLTESEYASIVEAARSVDSRILDASTGGGFHATVKVQPQSHKGHWEASCTVDPQTGNLTIYGGHQDSAALHLYVGEVHRQVLDTMSD